MRYAIIDGDQVANVALADDPEFAAAQGWLACPDDVGPGWGYSAGTFTPPAANDNGPVVPESVSRRQAKRALLDAGLLHLVDTAIAGMPSPQRERAEIDWAEAVEFRRDSPLVAFLGASLGLTSAQIDALFIAAAAIV